MIERISRSAFRNEQGGVVETLIRSARATAHVVILALAVALVLGLGGPWGWLLAIGVGGFLAAATCSGVFSAAVIGGLAGALGTGWAVAIYRAPRAVEALQGWKGGYPGTKVHVQFLAPLIRSSAVNGRWGAAAIGLFLVLVVGVVLIAMSSQWLLKRMSADRARASRVVFGTIAVTAVAAALVLSSFSGPFRHQSSAPLRAGGYSFDAAIYMNVYFNLLDGMPYYEGFVKAAAGDSRLIAEKSVRDGQFYGWVYSPSFVRMPWTFYLWRLLAPHGHLWYTSLLLCVIALYAVWWGLYPVLSVRAALIPPVLFPLLMMCTAWLNMFFPDWWAGLAILFSVMFQIRKRYVLAGVLALLAGVFRDVALIWLVLLLLHALARSWKGGAQWRRLTALYALFLAGFFALYFFHLRAAAPFVAPQPGAIGIGGRLAVSAANTFAQRFFVPASYMMVAYGTALGARALFVFAQLPGWWLVLRRDREALWPVFSFALFWMVFTATVGATSSYWGQIYTPVAVVGAAALLALAVPSVDAK